MAERTYRNPVYPSEFPDPYVLAHRGEYWAYCTGIRRDGLCFGVLRSTDLVTWEEAGGAMAPLDGGHTCYWAPEVIYENGRFLMYYSVGNHDFMHVRVATADAPFGPFVDSGARLTSEDFAIDPHVFVDRDGQRYLFYATDFLEHAYVGTGTVRDRMLGPFELEGRPRPVARARFDWQVFDPARVEKGGVRWHTVEGPFVLERKGRYYEMFSGGNWTNPSYGAAYATTTDVDTDEEWDQFCDGAAVLPVLRTIPEKVSGPGHNSVVRGPDNRQLFCVYHRWEGDQRVMAVDRLDWAGERLIVLGPSFTPQPAPIAPSVAGFASSDARRSLAPEWAVEGEWALHGGMAVRESDAGAASLGRSLAAASFALEIWVRLAAGDGVARLAILGGSERVLECSIGATTVAVARPAGGDGESAALAVGADFSASAFHLVRVEVDGARARVVVDEGAARWEGAISRPASALAVETEGAAAMFDGLAITYGYEDLFADEASTPLGNGWSTRGPGEWAISDGALFLRTPTDEDSTVVKDVRLSAYELVINARLAQGGGSYGFFPAMSETDRGPRLDVVRGDAGWTLVANDGRVERSFALGPDFDPERFEQFRMHKQGNTLAVFREGDLLGVTEAPAGDSWVGLCARRAYAAFDMVRVTALPDREPAP